MTNSSLIWVIIYGTGRRLNETAAKYFNPTGYNTSVFFYELSALIPQS